jgi:peptidoglycan/LPS O-acetylase OafA/YrhL
MILQAADMYMASVWVIFLVFFIIGILLAIWVYKDAKKREMNAVLWLIIVLIFGCCGCIVYLIVRK